MNKKFNFHRTYEDNEKLRKATDSANSGGEYGFLTDFLNEVKRTTNVVVEREEKEPFLTFEIFAESSDGSELIEINKSEINDLDDVKRIIKERYENFDVDQFVTMWLEAKQNGVQGVPGAVILVKTAEEIERQLYELFEIINRYQ